MTDSAEWLNQLPEAMRDGLLAITKAVAGMSKDEKDRAAAWFLSLYKDEAEHPAVRAYAQASFTLMAAAAVHATDPNTPGYGAKAARIEELTRMIARGKRQHRGDESPPS